MNSIDINLFQLINKSCANPVLDFLMPWVSWIGSGEAIIILAVILLIFKRTRTPGILLLAGLTASYYLSSSIKELIARPRPSITLPDGRFLEMMAGFSFPSTHAVQSFMAAAVLSEFFRKYVLFFGFACLVCFSRVYVGAHYPFDTVAGALLGSAIGFILTKVYSSVNIVK